MDNNNNYMLSLNILFWLKSICIQVDFVCIEHHNLFSFLYHCLHHNTKATEAILICFMRLWLLGVPEP